MDNNVENMAHVKVKNCLLAKDLWKC